MKVVFVYPGISSLGFNSIGLGAEGSWINHGLCSLSACAKAKGYDVELIDLRCLKNWSDYKKAVLTLKPDVLGVTMMSVDFDPAIKSLKTAKEVNTGIITVLGGPHPSIMPEELTGRNEIDYIIKGEGEVSFLKLLDAVKTGKPPEEKVMIGEQPVLDDLPFCDRELFIAEERPWWLTDKEPFVTVIAGRGCIYNCSYCQPAERLIFGRKVRRRSVDNVIAELKILREKYHFKSFMFLDDCLIEDPAWVKDFCLKYRSEGFDQEFICQGRADIICRYPELMKQMKDSGLVGIIIGFESGNQRVLNFIRKGVTVEQNIKAGQLCKELGIKMQGNYMLGIPTETNEEAMDTFRMMEKINPETHGHSIFTPAPGSDLFAYCLRNNLINFSSHGDYRRDPYKLNKIKGVDYEFLARAGRKMKHKKMSLLQIFLSNCVAFLIRRNRLTLEIIKRVLKIRFLNNWAHALLRKCTL